MTPAVGRIVHYWDRTWERPGPHAAIITDVNSNISIAIEVFGTHTNIPHYSKGDRFHLAVMQSTANGQLDHWWEWPPRAD